MQLELLKTSILCDTDSMCQDGFIAILLYHGVISTCTLHVICHSCKTCLLSKVNALTL